MIWINSKYDGNSFAQDQQAIERAMTEIVGEYRITSLHPQEFPSSSYYSITSNTSVARTCLLLVCRQDGTQPRPFISRPQSDLPCTGRRDFAPAVSSSNSSCDMWSCSSSRVTPGLRKIWWSYTFMFLKMYEDYTLLKDRYCRKLFCYHWPMVIIQGPTSRSTTSS